MSLCLRLPLQGGCISIQMIGNDDCIILKVVTVKMEQDYADVIFIRENAVIQEATTTITTTLTTATTAATAIAATTATPTTTKTPIKIDPVKGIKFMGWASAETETRIRVNPKSAELISFNPR